MRIPNRALAILHGVYYVATGLWPLVSLGTFELVTGPKKEGWLVKATGLQIAVVGAVLTYAGLRGRSQAPENSLLALGSAVALGGVDVTYVKLGRIRRIYLLDALAEFVLASCWIALWIKGRGRPTW